MHTGPVMASTPTAAPRGVRLACGLLVTLGLAACGGAPQESPAPEPQDAPGDASAEQEPERDAQRPTLTFGVVPQQAASRLAREWGPLLERVSAEVGVSLVFRTAPDIPTFEARCREGEYDFVYMNPYHYTVFHESPGYEAVACREGRIKGILVVRRGGEVSELDDLDGATIAFPAPLAFAATLLTGAGLREAGIEFEPQYVSSHDSVYLNVAKGLAPAGGGIMRTFRGMDEAVREELEVLWETPGYTPHAFAVHPRVEPGVRASVTAALLGLDDDEAGRALLEPLNVDALRAAVDADWDDIRALRIEVR